MRNYGISALCWAREVDDRRIVATFDQFLSLLSSACVWPLPSDRRAMGEAWLSCMLQISLSKLAARFFRTERET